MAACAQKSAFFLTGFSNGREEGEEEEEEEEEEGLLHVPHTCM
jgi:hypothetical protein